MMRTNRNTVRRALEYCRLEGDGLYPMMLGPEVGLVSILELTTENDGKGPYLSSIPTNPFTQTNGIRGQVVQDDGTNASAWYYYLSDYRRQANFQANDCVEHLIE